ncbi:porin family protein [Leeuwenhoekiella marinoflava]|uniref:Outer membrane protein with beta-barrel domain n=2 Tax=Leeuwenhoekiella marinoflava TaxID=988 RepID=A0A4Q0P9B6_9FLAO|nr:porin family protein [Leeuwenhoekiella marinoflava]RXG22399.1 outer membrane protein with beta-barrel domain [Leeuwenhoekiella marinoflava]SHF31381.1 Outer membrane protein beta-barrel domain-containing protein [Leeuwenhoekiella marinoflava DSM 3653]
MRSYSFLKLVIILLLSFSAFAQDSLVKTIDTAEVYKKYREDQFYLGVTFNLLTNKPTEIEQNGFSGGMHFGFIRDMPINKQRNFAIGIGAGLSMNTYNQNLFVGETASEESIFNSIDSSKDYDKNWLSTYLIEAPIQLRWRTSTATNYKFWRIYTGLQLGYVYAYKFHFEEPGNQVTQTDVPEFNRYRMGLTFSFGYDTFNFYFYYNLNPFFNNEAQINGSPIEINSLKLGLMFYIL